MDELEMVNGGIDEPDAMLMIYLGTKSGAIVGGFIGSGLAGGSTVVGVALGGSIGFSSVSVEQQSGI